MSRVTRCDGPGCSREDRASDHRYLGSDFTWIAVEANEDVDHGQFCSWICLAVWATNRAVERETPAASPSPTENPQ